jgi:hypothetical protein
VVGGAFWIDHRLPEPGSALLWKALALPVGFTAAYAVVAEQWIVAATAATALAVLAVFFVPPWRAAAADPATVAELEERMKKCC